MLTNGLFLARVNWSQPPDHGAAAARVVLEDAELTRQWLAELDTMRARMREVRDALAAADNRVAGLDLTALATQNGLFSILSLDKDQILAIREKHGVYMAGSGRINVAGLTMGNIDKFIAAVAAVSA